MNLHTANGTLGAARTKPPFRAEHVGSLLRPAAIKEARARAGRGEIGTDELRAVEDEAIRALIAQQESVGLQSITDGEARRAFWNYDFFEPFEGIESTLEQRKGFQFKNIAFKPKRLRVTGKLGAFSGHPMVEHFRFVRENTRGTAKMTIPSPTTLHFRFGRDGIPEDVYPDLDEFYADLATLYQKTIAAFADKGCTYLQVDDVYLAYLCDPEQRATLVARGDDPGKLPEIYAGLINGSVGKAPADMMLGMHLCRGNFRSSFVASGGYEPIADILFNGIKIQAYFMEYDSDRAGGFEPLRFLPKDKFVVLGLVTSKSGELEKKDDIKRRIDQAAKFAPLEQLCLSPQCGFSSTEEGNSLTVDQQWRKLELVREIADEVWG
jgi:5-methyltetrahydropteroyltriglutamate--homocysteine methyltransferase